MNGGQVAELDSDRRGTDIFIRCFDVLFASLGLVAAFPFLLFFWALIPMTSPGSAIFAQTRVGRNERPFRCLKLRTMRTGTPNLASHEVGGEAITGIGRLLRRTKLDELPQLLNVLRGDMSFVGPRPCLPTQIELIEARRSRNLLTLYPGITGPAQVRGIDMSEPEILANADLAWISERSIPAYFRVIFLTAIGGGQGDRTRA